MKAYILLLIVLLISPSTSSQTLEDLTWMAGYWTSSNDGTTMEELWMPPSAGIMLAIHRDQLSTGRASFEYLRIVQTESEILYIAQPGGSEPVAFKLVESKSGKAVFENLEHDFPQRIIYSRDGNSLTARIENEAGDQGVQWTWEKTTFN